MTIQRYEPMKTTVPSSAPQQESNKTEDDATPQDPLLSLGYQKSSVAFAVNGLLVYSSFFSGWRPWSCWLKAASRIKAAANQEKDEEGQGPR